MASELQSAKPGMQVPKHSPLLPQPVGMKAVRELHSHGRSTQASTSQNWPELHTLRQEPQAKKLLVVLVQPSRRLPVQLSVPVTQLPVQMSLAQVPITLGPHWHARGAEVEGAEVAEVPVVVLESVVPPVVLTLVVIIVLRLVVSLVVVLVALESVVAVGASVVVELVVVPVVMPIVTAPVVAVVVLVIPSVVLASGCVEGGEVDGK